MAIFVELRKQSVWRVFCADCMGLGVVDGDWWKRLCHCCSTHFAGAEHTQHCAKNRQGHFHQCGEWIPEEWLLFAKQKVHCRPLWKNFAKANSCSISHLLWPAKSLLAGESCSILSRPWYTNTVASLLISMAVQVASQEHGFPGFPVPAGAQVCSSQGFFMIGHYRFLDACQSHNTGSCLFFSWPPMDIPPVAITL